jgi:hypothetical protein
VVKIALPEYQVGGLSVRESFRVIPREHAIIGLRIAGAIGDVHVIWG